MRKRCNNRGFTLVETMAVILILSVVVTAVYSLYLTHLKTAYSQDEVVEVQQNLRIAMDAISKDLKLAGILVPLTTTPIGGGTASTLQINTVSPEGRFARVTFGPYTTHAVTSFFMKVDTPDAFTAGPPKDNLRVIQAFDNSQPLAPAATLTLVASIIDVANSKVTLAKSNFSNFSSGTQINTGDIIAKATGNGTAAGLKYDTITYSLVPCPSASGPGSCLARAVNDKAADPASAASSFDVIASNLSGLKFSFLYDNADESSTPGATGSAQALNQIKAVRVTVTGVTSRPNSAGWTAKTRELTSVIKLRNRRAS
jgi:prepilin-type N-terminal cleavage/methylation domain-containing protein